MHELKIEYVPKEQLTPYFHNCKLHPALQVEQIKNSIRDFGFNDPIGIYGNSEVVEGHGRLLAVMQMPEIKTVPVIRLDHMDDEHKRAYALAHNRLCMNSEFDLDLLAEELEAIDLDMNLYGFDVDTFIDFDEEVQGVAGALREKFLVPPFSVLYGNKGEWLDRKRYWMQFGIKSEIGRGGTCVSVSRVDGQTSIP